MSSSVVALLLIYVESGIESTSARVFIYPKEPDVVGVRVGVQRVLLLAKTLPLLLAPHRGSGPVRASVYTERKFVARGNEFS